MAWPHEKGKLIVYDAPDEWHFEQAIWVLEAKGYSEWARVAPSRLKNRTFTARKPSLKVYWKEPMQPRMTFLRRLEQLAKNLVPKGKNALSE